ncbi:AraC family transcriptional regulator ligand-binding domain-containing protein [Pseudomonas sp. CAN2814]|uniref:AraC family transcriptional regulator n=1 Tax=Pseudomonas sp. CAN1 TaxID=3046726 RepID=UPI00264A05D3|nr:AraC family transcriptional regulator [Pseudomonas sp. CAN1]MDN6856540.1 AraC family transcriptional regulator ligand-binding domain-containing protein [Pseudomonas sp. CAN1]
MSTDELNFPATPALTQSATLRRQLYEALSVLGYDPTDIYRQALQKVRLPPPAQSGRLVHDDAPLFWTTLDEITGDCDIGLHLGEAMKPRLLDVVGYLQMASSDLRQALQSFLRFQHILSGGFAAQMREEGEQVRLILDLNYLGTSSLRQQMECLMVLFLKLLGLITDGEFHFHAIEFRHPQPRRLSEHRRLFSMTPAFGKPNDALLFDRTLLARPSRTGNPALHRLLTEYAREQLGTLDENDLLNRLRYLIGIRLGEADCTLQSCARELGVRPGLLQRNLAGRAQTFRDVREDVRRQRAVEMLEQGAAIRDVARACGFAELSPFYRAFRRWYSMPPERYRQRLV